MSNERRGLAYEAVVHVALQELIRESVVSGKLFWNETPSGMSIKADLLVGRDKDHPDVVLMITRCTSARNSDMKCWRNLGELVEAKTCLPTIPKVFGLTFGSIKEALEPIQERAFDHFVWSRGKAWHTALDEVAATLVEEKALKPEAFPDEVARRNPRRVLDPLKAILAECFNAPPRRDLVALWNLHRQRVVPAAPSRRETNVRRGTAKLLVFEDPDLAARIHDGERVLKSAVPSYAFELGFAQKSTREAWGADSDIRSAVQCIGRADLVALAQRCLRPQMTEWYYTLRNHQLVPHLAGFIKQNFSEVCKPRWLRDHLQELYDDPRALISALPGVSSPPPTVWLFEFLVQLIRVSTGSANGYGYAQLGEEVIEKYSLRRASGGVPRIWVGGFVISDWVHRRKADLMTAKELEMISSVLAERVKAIGVKEVTKICDEMNTENAVHVLESKVIPYRMFDPLGELLQQKVPGFTEVRLNVCYREAAGIGGQAGRMDVGRAQNTLINWQSCTDSGRDHKKKELCGRAAGLRYHWNGKNFVRRPGVEKLLLLLDGTWRDEDLKALLQSGWDDVFYPDEIDKLIKAIV
jgi:hypothetical protein